MKKIFMILLVSFILPKSLSAMPITKNNTTVKNIILVHGAYVDASGWKPVFEQLTKQGYTVYAAQLPETSLKEDVATVNRIIKYIKNDVILVGHSYGGIVITQAGNHPSVKGLVYIAAVVPEENEEIKSLRIKFKAPADDVVKLGDGFQMLNPKTFHADFAADIPKEEAEFMAYSQVAIAVPAALGAKVTKAAWKYKPSWYLVPTEDRKINPDLLRFMAKRAKSTTIEVKGSHAILLSNPTAVSKLIIEASKKSLQSKSK